LFLERTCSVFFGGPNFHFKKKKPENLCFQQIQKISVKKMALAYNSPGFEKKIKIKIKNH
jgi:hypothetical protein